MSKTLEIKIYPEEILKKKAKEVKDPSQELGELALDMERTMKEKEGIGLAAPQIGVSKRIILVQTEKGPQIFFNPEIIKKSKEAESMEEGCLSLPGLFLEVKRAKEVTVQALNREGRKVEIQAKGILARIFQHELDHLNGLLIIDKVSFWQRWKLRTKLKQYGFGR